MNSIIDPKVSLLIRSYNELCNLKILLPLLDKQNYKNFQVVYLDSGSTDGSLDYVKKFNSKYQIIIDTIKQENFTYGGALNQCAELAKGSDYLISLSAHCFPKSNDFIKNYIMIFQETKASIVFGKQVGYKNSSVSEAAHLDNWFKEDYSQKLYSFSNNGNAGYPYEFWKNYKFDPSLSGCEDIEIARRGLKDNKIIVYGEDIAVEHFHEESNKQIYNRFNREAIAISFIFSNMFRLTIFQCFSKIISDIKDALNFKKQNEGFNKNSIFHILNYFILKNTAQYIALKKENSKKLETTENQSKASDHKFYKKYFFNQ